MPKCYRWWRRRADVSSGSQRNRRYFSWISRYSWDRTLTLGTNFRKLNDGWDAEGGDPEPNLRTSESGLTLTFFLSSSIDHQFREYDRGEIFFPNCWRYRLGYPNDEGWHMGHCRFRCWAIVWGDFYEVTGDLLDDGVEDWVLVKPAPPEPSRHFLFYFKDETFECDADSWSFRALRISDADYARLLTSESRITLQRTTVLGILREILLEPIRAARRWIRRGNIQ